MFRHRSFACLVCTAMICSSLLPPLASKTSATQRRTSLVRPNKFAAARSITPTFPQQPQAQSSPSPDSLKPFADVVRDAVVFSGLFTIYRKDSKVYIEILPDQFDQIYLCSPVLDSGLGERSLLSATEF